MTLSRSEPARPQCPFCDAPWSDDMLALFDRYTVAGGCSCCAGPGEHHHSQESAELPTEDIRCAACGKALYRAPNISAAVRG